ncbi:GNAT family N-acetyltransferase [Alicyclobacillus dauci]|uniref:GNAT family N-acetyltransferase n=1 Tax=Alicyclobacillus dauci TaxID=1475485 RepID=A0ABY6Z4D1_9BACL|nr:GNAT family N-acetyltransferase [Alicyclobacillus dauci]WAH37176.1 GNAT family N-acetyltransferase [Alicyclobacillus dauci]
MANTFLVQRAEASDIPALGELLDSVFRPQLVPGQGMPKEFPHLICAENAHNIYFVSDNGRPVSMVAVLIQETVFQGVTMPVVSIGSVCTRRAYEGRGISSQILDQVIRDLKADEIPLMLVSGTRGLYRRIHCVPVGKMYEVEWSADAAVAATSEVAAGQELFRVCEIPGEQKGAVSKRLAAIYRAEAYRFRRTDEQMEQLLDALWFQRDGHDQRLFTIEQGTNTVAYAVAYEDKDRPGIVTVMEWAGSRTAFLMSATPILKAFGATKLVWHVHVDDCEMRAKLRTMGITATTMSLQGTVRALDVPRLFSYLQPILRERFGGEVKAVETDGKWRVQSPLPTMEFTDIEDIVRWLFDHEENCLRIPFVHTDDLNFI